jgi:hypothetical protein
LDFERDSSERPVIEEEHYKGKSYNHRFTHEPKAKKQKGKAEGEGAALCLRNIRFLCVSDVGQQREKCEEGTEHVFALGDPGYGFDVERMDGEQGSDKSAGPEPFRSLIKHEKQEAGVTKVNEEAGEVVVASIQAERFDVEHMGKPSQRVPIAEVRSLECPSNVLRAQPAQDIWILGDVEGVIEIYEAVVKYGPKSDYRQPCQQDTDQKGMAKSAGINQAENTVSEF